MENKILVTNILYSKILIKVVLILTKINQSEISIFIRFLYCLKLFSKNKCRPYVCSVCLYPGTSLN